MSGKPMRRRLADMALWALLLAAAAAAGLLTLAGGTWPGDMAAFFRPQIAVCDRTSAAAGSRAAPAGPVGRVRGAARALRRAAFPAGKSGGTRCDARRSQDRLGQSALRQSRQGAFSLGRGRARARHTGDAGSQVRMARGTARPAGIANTAGPEIARWNGNIVLSRFPMKATLVPDMPPSGEILGGGQAIRVEVQVHRDAAPLILYAIHAPTPRTLVGWQARNLYLATIARRIAAEPSRQQGGAGRRLEHAGLDAGIPRLFRRRRHVRNRAIVLARRDTGFLRAGRVARHRRRPHRRFQRHRRFPHLHRRRVRLGPSAGRRGSRLARAASAARHP